MTIVMADITITGGTSRKVKMTIPKKGSFLGVNREPGVGWNITHLLTGYLAYPMSFSKKSEALAALTALSPDDPCWDNNDKKTAPDNARHLFQAAAKSLGHEYLLEGR